MCEGLNPLLSLVLWRFGVGAPHVINGFVAVFVAYVVVRYAGSSQKPFKVQLLMFGGSLMAFWGLHELTFDLVFYTVRSLQGYWFSTIDVFTKFNQPLLLVVFNLGALTFFFYMRKSLWFVFVMWLWSV